MTYPRYAAYKDSGVAWLGQIPAHWDLYKLKYLADFVTRGNSPSYVDESNIKVVNQACVQDDGLMLERVRYNADVDISEFKGKLQIQDVLLNSTGTGTLGRVALFDINDDNYMADGHVTIVRDTNNRFLPKYLYYYLKPRQEWITAFISDGATNQIELNRDKLRNILLPVPPLAEQRAIAAFLDGATARIDTLIARQTTLIALLHEKRKALISHAVTRGLDRDAPMKDSGVAWLGMVPEHWDVKRLSKVAYLHRGYDLTADARKEGTVPVITSGGFVDFHNEAKAPGPGVVMGRYGTTGELFYVEEDYWPHNTALYVDNFRGNLQRYVFYLLQILPFEAHSGKSAVPGIDRNDLHVLLVCEPPLNEQPAIAAFLDRETAKLDALIDKAQTAIALLREHRAALIAAAVTGAIDAREMALTPGPSPSAGEGSRRSDVRD